MVMLTCAFDVSKDQPLQKNLVMAGFVSEAERWKEYDLKWRARLAADNLSYFHMRSFAQSDGPFKDWRDKEDKRRTLLRDLLDLIAEHAYHKFACVVTSQSYASLSEAAKHHFAPTAIAVAAKFCAGLVYTWRDQNRYQDQNPRFVFEQGDEDKGSLITIMESLTGYAPSFEYKKDNPEKQIIAFTPLQAADILAYEVKKIADNLGKPLPENFRFRFPYQQLDKIPGEPRVFDLESVPEAENIARVNEYFRKYPLGGTVQ